MVLGTCWGTLWELWEQVGGTHWVQGASSHLLSCLKNVFFSALVVFFAICSLG
jgi:hypothetical protein